MRTETTINTRDFNIGKRLQNLPALRKIGFQANRRLLDVQTVSHDCLLAETEFTESAHGAGSNQQEMFAVGDVIMNQWQIVNGYFTPLIPIAVIPGWGQADGTISSIVNAPKQFDVWKGGVLSPTAQSNLNYALNQSVTSGLCGDLAEPSPYRRGCGVSETFTSCTVLQEIYRATTSLSSRVLTHTAPQALLIRATKQQ